MALDRSSSVAPNVSVLWAGSFEKHSPVKEIIDEEDSLKRLSLGSEHRRARICFHNSPVDESQFMLIYLCSDSHIQIHRHHGYEEMYIPVSGSAMLVTFDNELRLTSRSQLSTEQESGRSSLRIVTSGTWHTIIPGNAGFKYFEYKKSRHPDGEERLKLTFSGLKFKSIIERLDIGGAIEYSE